MTKTVKPDNSWIQLLTLQFLLLIMAAFLVATQANAQNAGDDNRYTVQEIVSTGHNFFGNITGGLAAAVERAAAQHGLPNGYILGEEGSAAFVAGARYGEGYLHTKNMGQHKVFWQGPSVGWDFGGDGNRTMMLVYNLPSIDFLYQRWGGINGSAYLVGGFGMSLLSLKQKYYIVPIRSGVGARLGVNLGYVKFSQKPTWNPF